MSRPVATAVDALLVRATFPDLTTRAERQSESMAFVSFYIERYSQFGDEDPERLFAAFRAERLTDLRRRERRGSDDEPSEVLDESLPGLARQLDGLHDFIQMAKRVPSITRPAGISDEVWQLAREDAARESDQRAYHVVSLRTASPLEVIVRISPEAAVAFGLSLMALAERVATTSARVSRKRAKELRDRAAYDRERQLIESGRLDMAFRALKSQARPATIEIVGVDEDFENADEIEPGQLEPDSGEDIAPS